MQPPSKGCSFTVKGDPPSVTPSKEVYRRGEPIVIDFKNGPGNEKDWIGLYKREDGDGSDFIIEWQYVDGTQVGSTGETEGRLTFSGLPLGRYEARFFEDDGFTRLDSSSFRVRFFSFEIRSGQVKNPDQ